MQFEVAASYSSNLYNFPPVLLPLLCGFSINESNNNNKAKY